MCWWHGRWQQTSQMFKTHRPGRFSSWSWLWSDESNWGEAAAWKRASSSKTQLLLQLFFANMLLPIVAMAECPRPPLKLLWLQQTLKSGRDYLDVLANQCLHVSFCCCHVTQLHFERCVSLSWLMLLTEAFLPMSFFFFLCAHI